MHKHKLLLVEDDPNFGSVLKDYLTLNGYDITLSINGEEALKEFQKAKFDLIISDVMMPVKDGFTFAAEIKKAAPSQALIFLTAKGLKDDMLTGFKIGADDYINKPFDAEVLLYKIKAVLNRSQEHKESDTTIFEIGSLHFNYSLRELSISGEKEKLSPKEAHLLKLLCEHLNQVLPRQKALKIIWGDDNYFNGRSMDVYITKLRKLLKNTADLEIENLHGSGFKLTQKL